MTEVFKVANFGLCQFARDFNLCETLLFYVKLMEKAPVSLYELV